MSRWLRHNAINMFAGLAIVYMLIPIAVIALFSFNDPPGSSTSPGRGSRSSTGRTRSGSPSSPTR